RQPRARPCTPPQIFLSRHFENCRVSPKKQRRLALDRIDVWPAAIDNLVRDDRIDRFIKDWLRMEQRWKSGHDREQDNPKRDPLEESQTMILFIHDPRRHR